MRALAWLQAELLCIRVALNQVRADLNQTATSASRDVANNAAASAAASLADLDHVISQLHLQLAQATTPAAPPSSSPPKG